MTKVQVTCPECGARLALHSPPAGKKIRCPKCELIFAAAEGAARPAAGAGPVVRESESAAGREERPRRNLAPARRRRPRPKKQGVPPGVALAVIAASVLILGGAGVG